MLTSYDGGRLFGELKGSGEPVVVALHGWRRDHRDFAAVLGGEAARRALVSLDVSVPDEAVPSLALDLPGFGASPAPPQPWGSFEYSEAVSSVLASFDRPVILVGHSFGGRVAVQLAAARPDKVAGLVLTGAPLFAAFSVTGRPPPRAPLGFRLARTMSRFGVLSAGRMEALRERYGSADYRASTGVMRGVLVRALAEEREAAYTPALRALSCPVELVWGEDDAVVPVAVAQRISAELSEAPEITILTSVGHLTPTEAPGALRSAIERLRAKGPA